MGTMCCGRCPHTAEKQYFPQEITQKGGPHFSDTIDKRGLGIHNSNQNTTDTMQWAFVVYKHQNKKQLVGRVKRHIRDVQFASKIFALLAFVFFFFEIQRQYVVMD